MSDYRIKRRGKSWGLWYGSKFVRQERNAQLLWIESRSLALQLAAREGRTVALVVQNALEEKRSAFTADEGREYVANMDRIVREALFAR